MNNPASRLLYWLELGMQHNSDQAAISAWCATFGLDRDRLEDRLECMRRGAMIGQLAIEVRRQAEARPHSEIMLEHFDQVERCVDHFTGLINVVMAAMMNQIGEGGWQALRYWASALALEEGVELSQSDINDHLLAVRALIDEVLADEELEQDLKKYIVDRLREVEGALIDSQFLGVDRIKNVVDAVQGDAILEPDWWDRIVGSKWGPRVVAVWRGLVVTVSASTQVLALMHGLHVPVPVILPPSTIRVQQIHHERQALEGPNPPEDVVDGEFVDEPPES